MHWNTNRKTKEALTAQVSAKSLPCFLRAEEFLGKRKTFWTNLGWIIVLSAMLLSSSGLHSDYISIFN